MNIIPSGINDYGEKQADIGLQMFYFPRIKGVIKNQNILT